MNMTKPRTYYQLIPAKVMEVLPSLEEAIRPEVAGFSTDYLKEVISIVALHVRKDEEEAAPLKMEYIKKLVPQGDKYMKALKKIGIIAKSGYYIPGEISYKYRFNPEYTSKYIRTPLTNAKLIRRIEASRKVIRKEANRTLRGHTEQVPYLSNLTIDPGYLEYLNTNYSTDTDQYNSIYASATRITNGDITYSIDSTSGRFHSNVTNIAKVLRPYLRINGEPLCNIDVKNSQPYLSVIILTNPSKVSYLTENTAFAMLLQTLKVTMTEDVTHYIELVITGRLYEYLMDEYAAEGLHLDRTETKRQVLRILFARNRNPRDPINRQAREIFKARFPKVHQIFSKVRGNVTGDRFHNFKRFAILLQRIESYLMLDVVLKRIYRELPGTIAVTVHDSIMTGILTNNVESVAKIIVEEFTFFVGSRPTTNIEGLIERVERKEEGRGRCTYSNHYDATISVNIN